MEINRNSVETIGASVVVISKDKTASATTRKNIILINTSSAEQVISLSIDEPAVAGSGIVLNPGGFWSDNAEGGYLPTQKMITAIASAAGGTLAIQERLEQ